MTRNNSISRYTTSHITITYNTNITDTKNDNVPVFGSSAFQSVVGIKEGKAQWRISGDTKKSAFPTSVEKQHII